MLQSLRLQSYLPTVAESALVRLDMNTRTTFNFLLTIPVK